MQQATRRRWLDEVVAEVVDGVFPKRCAECGRRGGWVCTACVASIAAYAPPWCDRCGIPEVAETCRCPALPPELDSVRSYGPYDGWLAAAIRRAKYDGEWARIDHLAEIAAPIAHSTAADAILVPVPLHRARYRERGYNQSLLLARALGRLSERIVVEALQRTRATHQQVGLDADERRRNVAGAFGLIDGFDLEGRNVVLVDDVVTTGSTLAACATVIRMAKANSVSAFTLAGERGDTGSNR